MARDWRAAFFEQARSDFRTMELLQKEGVATCQCLHYLQMATEKLAKGFLTPSGGVPPPKVHDALVRFLQIAASISEVQRALNVRDPARLRAYISDLLLIAPDVEKLAPAIAGDAPNPEYPWSDATGVFAPVDYSFPNLDVKSNPKLRKLISFVDKCFLIV